MKSSEGLSAQDPEPVDILSYDDVVDIIMNDKSVPNLIEVDDTILDESLNSKPQLKPRLKPWETQHVVLEDSTLDGAGANGLGVKGTSL